MKKKFRKIVAVVMTAVMMFQMTACKGTKDEAVEGTVAEAESIDTEALAKLETNWETAQSTIAKMAELSLGEDTTSQSYENYIAGLEEITGQLDESVKSLETISTKDENVNQTITATKEYINEYIEIINTTIELVAITEIVVTIADSVGNSEENSINSELYNQWSEALKQLEYSEYLKQSMEYYSDALNIAKVAVEGYEKSVISEDKIDPLIYNSAVTVEELAKEKIVEASTNLVNVYEASFTQMSKLKEGRLATMQAEIIDNIKNMNDGKIIAEFSYMAEEKEVSVNYTGVEDIYPSEYNSNFSLLHFDAVCDQGEMDILVKAEVEGLTQTYEQTFTVGRELTRIYVKPPILTTGLNLSAPFTAQLKFTVTSTDGSEVYYQKTDNVQVMSIHDFRYDTYADVADLLSWVTPNSEEIMQLNRDAIEVLEQSQAPINGMIGYQGASTMGEAFLVTGYQSVAVMHALSNSGVRYNMSNFSLNALQSIILPKEVIEKKSGVCIDLSLAVASALQAAGFNTFLILPTGHARVAVEIWPGSGEYYILECTRVPVEGHEDFNFTSLDEIGSQELADCAIVNYLTYNQIVNYFSEQNVRVIDCSLAKELNMEPLVQ